MAAASSAAGLYRSTDSLKCFKMRVNLRRVAGSRHFDVPRSPVAETEDGIEMRPPPSPKREPPASTTNADGGEVETCMIGWQEKLFSEREEDLFAEKSNCISGLELKYHDDVVRLKTTAAGGRPNNRIFTYVDADQYIDASESESVENTGGTATYLATNVLRWRRRRRPAAFRHPGGDGSTLPVPKNPVCVTSGDAAAAAAHVKLSPLQVMHVMADLSPADRLGLLGDERLLCTVRVNSRGVIQIQPDFNGHTCSKYTVESAENEVYEYVIEHASKGVGVPEKIHESKMFRELYIRHGEVLAGAVGQDFAVVPTDNAVRVNVFGEIVAGADFEYDHLYVQYTVGLPDSWSLSSDSKLTGMSQISVCRKTTGGRHRVAHWGLPFEFELLFQPNLLEEGQVSQQPIIYFQVMSLDFWNRHRTEGYGSIFIPDVSGVYQKDVTTWRPLGHGLVSTMRRFFVGGTPELDDLAYIFKSIGYTGTHLSRYGFRTETCGSITVRMHVAIQCADCIRSAALLQATSGGQNEEAQLNPGRDTLASVLDAFQRARQRMQQVRDSLKY